jgi:hypothetical protein
MRTMARRYDLELNLDFNQWKAWYSSHPISFTFGGGEGFNLCSEIKTQKYVNESLLSYPKATRNKTL